ncbi:FliM/FliN family flagellar motor switch protein [Donghicola tyrosinivorans]|uniref:Flagellar motor switch protein FliM n=1 Tax=Donghicola tyrosinivorans TaxID=1652492 RepID=A0A2T0WJA5_9RHOB|nr:FliM/FliN family flagellar motor switch protein [Donghicola tyrosinivorans]PRY86790.1 flagellar motor switch protein FliM [Donghicola tyrosinivorans]
MGDSILRSMANGGRPEPQQRFARSCEVAFGAGLDHPVRVMASGRGQVAARLIPDNLEAGTLILLLDAADGRTGALLVPPLLSAGMVQLLTFGMLTAASVAPRMPTATDAALLEPLVNRVLDDMAEADQGFERLRFGALLAPAHFARVMPEGALDEYWSELKLGADHSGKVRLIMPPPMPDEASEVMDPAEWRAALSENVSAAQVSLQVVLEEYRMPLQRVEALSVGDELTIPMEALERAQLRISNGEKVGIGKLGRFGGRRAFKFTDGQKAEPAPALPVENENGASIEGSPV